MATLPFDPMRARGAEPIQCAAPGGSSQPPNEPSPLSVSQASDLIKSALEQKFQAPLRVAGEISNFSARGHWYFSLKDEGAVLSCVAWATAVKKFGFVPKDGDAVVATGHVSHYPPQGRTQLYVSDLKPAGAGPLEQRFRALCEELRAKGYFADERKKPLPLLPCRIAVVTSASGAALQDVITTAAQRCRAVGLLVADVRVQGDGAASQIAEVIRWIDVNRRSLCVDAILVTRGGGSLEDLWAFNERVVADAVLQCALPVVAAIGHESDTTIVELVADVRASTPTQAAMRLVPAASELTRHIDHLSHRMSLQTRRIVQLARRRMEEVMRWRWLNHPRNILVVKRDQMRRHVAHMSRNIGFRFATERARLERLTGRLAALRPQTVLLHRASRLTEAGIRLHAAACRRLRHDRHRLELIERQLTAMDPHAVLRRGYSITMLRGGRVVRSVDETSAGAALTTRLADGSVDSIVAGGVRRRKVVARNGEAEPAQLDLFGPLG